MLVDYTEISPCFELLFCFSPCCCGWILGFCVTTKVFPPCSPNRVAVELLLVQLKDEITRESQICECLTSCAVHMITILQRFYLLHTQLFVLLYQIAGMGPAKDAY